MKAENLKINRLAFGWALTFLFIAGAIGVLIRWHYHSPIDGLQPGNWIHAHSHITFLGWAFLGIMAVLNHCLKNEPAFRLTKFIPVIWLTVAANLGMLVSFPLQGYSPLSLIFSAIQMITGLYAYLVYRPFLRDGVYFGRRLVHSGFIFMILSGLGPLALGPIIAMGLRDSYWYDLAIYFYLHFQYNGWFTLAIMGILFMSVNIKDLHRGWLYAINVSILITYFLSVLAIRPPLWLYYFAGLGALLQILSFVYLLWILLRNYKKLLTTGQPFTNVLLLLAMIVFETKLYLQFFSSIPSIADWALHSKSIIIAYLHFVLLGFMSAFLLGWWHKIMYRTDSRIFAAATIFYIVGLTAMEFILLFYATGVFREYLFVYQLLLFFSIMLLVGIFLFFLDGIMRKRYA